MNAHDELIFARDHIVTDYGRIRPARELTTEITAFPGGTGFLAGEPGARRVMLVLHNYDSEKNARKPVSYKGAFWLTLRIYLKGAGLRDDEVFLTNYYMGLNPVSAFGEMASHGGPDFRGQCRRFFNEQVRIVDPALVIVLGEHAWNALIDWNGRPKVYVAHPSSNQDANRREQRAAKWIRAIQEALGGKESPPGSLAQGT